MCTASARYPDGFIVLPIGDDKTREEFLLPKSPSYNKRPFHTRVGCIVVCRCGRLK